MIDFLQCFNYNSFKNLNFQAYGELESKRLYDVSVNTLREEK